MHVIRLWNLNNARDENKQAQIVLKGYFGDVFEVGCIRYSSVVMDPSLSRSVLTKKVYLNTPGLCFLSSPWLPQCWISQRRLVNSDRFWLAVRVSVVGQVALKVIQKRTVTTDIVLMPVLWTFTLTVICIDGVLSVDHHKLCVHTKKSNRRQKQPAATRVLWKMAMKAFRCESSTSCKLARLQNATTDVPQLENGSGANYSRRILLTK